MSKIALISAALVSVGFGVQMAVEEAERLAPKLTKHVKVPAGRSEGLMAETPITERISTYAEKKKGNVWTLSTLALATGIKKDVLSTNITALIRKGVIRRTGRAEYVKA